MSQAYIYDTSSAFDLMVDATCFGSGKTMHGDEVNIARIQFKASSVRIAGIALIHPLIFSETQKNRHCLTEIPKRIERSR